MDLSLSLNRNFVTTFLVIIFTWLLALGMAWAIATDNLFIFLIGFGGIAIAVTLLRWPSLVFVVIYPLTWIFWSYNITGIGKPERIVGTLGIMALLLIALGPRRASFPSLPGLVITGLMLLMSAYLVSAWLHPAVSDALDYVISLLTRIAFFYLAYFHLRTTKQLRWATILFVSAGVAAGLLTLGVSVVYGFGFSRDLSTSSAALDAIGPFWMAAVKSGTFATAPALLLLVLYPMTSGRVQKLGIIGLTVFLFSMAFAAEYRREVLITVPFLMLLLMVDKTAGLRRLALWLLGLFILLFFQVALPYSLVLQGRLEYETQFVIAGTEPRIASALAGLQAAANSPLTGYGPGAYSQAVFPILGPGRHIFEYSPYNVFVWIIVEAGMFGLLGIVFILLGTYRQVSRSRIGAKGVEGLVLRSAPALLFLIVIWYTFGAGWDLSLPWFLMGFILAAARLVGSESEPQRATG